METRDPKIGPDDTAALRERLERAELLLEVTDELASLDRLDDVLESIVRVMSVAVDAERSTLFLNDSRTNELFSRIAQGEFHREIRFSNTLGVAGTVFQSGESLTIDDAYADPRFNSSIDEQTGFVTRNILCVPVYNLKGKIIGAAQSLNRRSGRFNPRGRGLLEQLSRQAASALEQTRTIENLENTHSQALEFLDIITAVTTDIDLYSLLRRVMRAATKMLRAELSVLFLADDATGELWSNVSDGGIRQEVRIPNDQGIPGTVFRQGEPINLPHAYADLRFDPALDERLGVFTRSVLCIPVRNRAGDIIGVTQVINKRGGPFDAEDLSWLQIFTNQVAIGLENAKMFADV